MSYLSNLSLQNQSDFADTTVLRIYIVSEEDSTYSCRQRRITRVYRLEYVPDSVSQPSEYVSYFLLFFNSELLNE